MFIYLLAFALSYILGIIADKKMPRYSKIWAVLAFMPLLLLAALRGPEVGVDTDYYPLPYFHYSQTMSLPDMMAEAGCEPGFSALIWLLSRLTGSFNAVLFAIQLLMVLPLIITLSRTQSLKVSTSVFVYACVIFPSSLNLMRQTLAGSLLPFSLYYAAERKPFKFILSVVLATSIHLTGLFGALLYPICVWSSLSKPLRTKVALFGILCLLAMIGSVIVFPEQILGLFLGVKDSYSVTLLQGIGHGDFNFFLTVFPIMVSASCCVASSRAPGASGETLRSLSMVFLLSATFALLSIVNLTLGRIGLIFLALAPIAISEVQSVLGNRLTYFLLAFSLVLFCWVYCYGNAAGIIPYEIQFYGFLGGK